MTKLPIVEYFKILAFQVSVQKLWPEVRWCFKGKMASTEAPASARDANELSHLCQLLVGKSVAGESSRKLTVSLIVEPLEYVWTHQPSLGLSICHIIHLPCMSKQHFLRDPRFRKTCDGPSSKSARSASSRGCCCC